MTPALPLVSGVRFVSASSQQRTAGLLGYVRFELGDAVRLDGITLRRTRAGRLSLSFPERHGTSYPLVRPLDAEVRRAIEAQVFSALVERGVIPAEETAS